MKKEKDIFIEGPIEPSFIANSIEKHRSKHEIGAHDIFLGQVRADFHEKQTVSAIEYTAHQQVANTMASEIREKAFEKFGISCMHIHHSLGKIATGELCLFVFASSPHRDECRKAVSWLVEEVKQKLPIFGKVILDNNEHQWKVNT
ncbi:MAG: molybdenum cofactor biosynthesis protein MoaE [Vicingaceae bacterium]